MTLPLPAQPDDSKQQQVNDFLALQFPLGPQHLQDNAVTAAAIAAGAVGTSEIATDGVGAAEVIDGSLTDTELASPNNSVYRVLLRVSTSSFLDRVAGTYFFQEGGGLQVSGADGTTIVSKYLDDADYTVGGKTTRLRIRGTVSPNGTVPAITFTFGLYPITFAGGADALNATLGTVVSSSTAAISSPSANGTTEAHSADFAVPANGLYAPAVVFSGTQTNNNLSLLTAELAMRHT